MWSFCIMGVQSNIGQLFAVIPIHRAREKAFLYSSVFLLQRKQIYHGMKTYHLVN